VVGKTAIGGPLVSMSKVVKVCEGASVFVGISEIDRPKEGRQWWGKVEFNPSRLMDPAGVSLASVSASRGLVDGALGVAHPWIRPSCEVEELRVKRVDVARDFEGVVAPASLIRALAPVHRPHSRLNLVHADRGGHGAETLMVGSGAGVVRLYDKHVQSGGVAAAGTVRWEAECREWARSAGLRTVADLEASKVSELARDRWEWSKVGVEVGCMSAVVDKVRQESGLSVREQTMFLGFLVDQAHGGAYMPGKKALVKWRKVQRDLGIAVGELGSVGDQAAGFLRRLDWESGRESYRVSGS
jgi:hypothetical protein